MDEKKTEGRSLPLSNYSSFFFLLIFFSFLTARKWTKWKQSPKLLFLSFLFSLVYVRKPLLLPTSPKTLFTCFCVAFYRWRRMPPTAAARGHASDFMGLWGGVYEVSWQWGNCAAQSLVQNCIKKKWNDSFSLIQCATLIIKGPTGKSSFSFKFFSSRSDSNSLINAHEHP